MGTLDLEAMVAGAVTVGLRVSGILVFAPFLGSSSMRLASREGWHWR